AKKSADELDERLLSDPQHEALAKLIEEKRERGRDVLKAPAGAAAADAEVIDLMEVLRRSLSGVKERATEAPKKEEPARAGGKHKNGARRSSRSAGSKAG